MISGGTDSTQTRAVKDGIVLSVDAMGSDKGPTMVVEGLDLFFENNPQARVLLHGRLAALEPLVKGKYWAPRVDLVHAEGVVTMDDKPAQVMRHGRNTSMWSAVDAVRTGAASICVSCGNTGALMAVSMLQLRKVEGVNRPAISCLWPSAGPAGFNVLLDAGADIRADQDDLLNYAYMGVAFARAGLNLPRPRVGLLNVGTEEHKGRAELKLAHEMIAKAAVTGDFEFVGFVEGSEMARDRADVVVTDGFTGNVALKTAEGTARFVTGLLKESLTSSLIAKIGALLAKGGLKRMQTKADPRRANGGVFLGLNGTVVKSHGGSDATSMAHALNLAYRLAQGGITEKLAAQLAAVALGQDLGAPAGQLGTAETTLPAETDKE